MALKGDFVDGQHYLVHLTQGTHLTNNRNTRRLEVHMDDDDRRDERNTFKKCFIFFLWF